MAASKRTPKRRSTLGSILPHRDHYKARYTRYGQWHTPGHTFSSFQMADQWLAAEQLLIDRGEWTPPAERRAAAAREATVNEVTFGSYSERWIKERQVRGRALKERTAADYRDMRRRYLARFLDVPVVAITKPDVVAWYHAMDENKQTARAHAYSLFRSIMASAVEDGLITTNPVHIRGAGSRPRKADVELFTADEIGQLADLMPPRHRATVLLAAWCGLRFGELAALRRSDLELSTDGPSLLHVRRGAVRAEGKQYETSPKSTAGERTVVIPPHIVDDLRAHLRDHAQWGQEGLVFPPTSARTDYLTPGQLYGTPPRIDPASGKVLRTGAGYYLARHELGRPDLSFHKLRHFAATNYAVAGATTKELMSLMGHADPDIAMRYQHAAQSRATELAAKVSALASLAATDGL
ncbi:site-specific integrase [Mariniluteicoccus endophyticus]